MSVDHKQKLDQLIDTEGYDSIEDFAQESFFDSVVLGICAHPHCDYTTDVEPDQQAGWCEVCDDTSVISGMELFLAVV